MTLDLTESRHPSESWDPATSHRPKALGPSFRWDDEKAKPSPLPATHFTEARS